jgi:hypothetical protein
MTKINYRIHTDAFRGNWIAFLVRPKRNLGSYQPLLAEEEVPEVYASK